MTGRKPILTRTIQNGGSGTVGRLLPKGRLLPEGRVRISEIRAA
jgi:hypothetical protein